MKILKRTTKHNWLDDAAERIIRAQTLGQIKSELIGAEQRGRDECLQWCHENGWLPTQANTNPASSQSPQPTPGSKT